MHQYWHLFAKWTKIDSLNQNFIKEILQVSLQFFQSYPSDLGAVPKRMATVYLEDIRLNEETIISMDGEIEPTVFNGWVWKAFENYFCLLGKNKFIFDKGLEGYVESRRRRPESRKVQCAVAFLSLLSLAPFILFILHMAILFGPIKNIKVIWWRK